MRGPAFDTRDETGDPLTDLLTRAQVSATLGVSPRTLDRWHALRVGPPRIKLGRRILYRRRALDAWILRHESSEIDSRASSPRS